ncbi:hypothetical protein A9264_08395 [Vibrio sp. UCD-FRSSP16_10]|uniref:Tad domain-containing protein n=1 Tax=unclassified Vibrio TaxID=2614977 RepID=UPI0007FD4809|nr:MULTISPECIES: Tad domain-containing protein [unclassified Vibrio]OBT06583.1 hypothetical protein A9260_09180 [Vibrio sp. UCD-FRSSP16_30]OBT12280.1 hypothetical protein A9264_08395 [Vibrio sp. UCD-FRSSP16_10]
MHRCSFNRGKQSGLVIIVFTLALTVLLGFAALAIDINHLVLNKSRLQNGVDAAALAGAVVADADENQNKIALAILDTLKNYSSLDGNTEISVDQSASFQGQSLSLQLSDSATLTIQLSDDPTSFPGTVGNDDDTYVRVEVSGVSLSGFFVGLFGLDKSVSASAVAGPSSSVETLCNLVPMAACAIDENDKDFGGFTIGEMKTLKTGDWKKSEIGAPGNFGLLNYGEQGMDDLDEHLAGGYNECLVDGVAKGAPGNKVGIVKNGLNTRFGDPNDPDYPKDILTTSGSVTKDDDGNITDSTFTYDNYVTEISRDDFIPETGGEPGRRILQMPILNCTQGTGSGAGFEAPVVTIGCFFLISKAPESNGNGNNEQQEVYGEFIQSCRVNNASFGLTPSNSGAYKIQLYKDPSGAGA